MKKKTWVIDCISTYRYQPMRHDHHTYESRGSIQKAIGQAVGYIHLTMGGEKYVIEPEMRSNPDEVLLTGEGRRGGYPEQPERVTVLICEKVRA
ncbi:MAG: hypothetical protein IKE76_04375 [Clostridia bacterium]|nr:hypothetical protein [Clostridia bacterium]